MESSIAVFLTRWVACVHPPMLCHRRRSRERHGQQRSKQRSTWAVARCQHSCPSAVTNDSALSFVSEEHGCFPPSTSLLVSLISWNYECFPPSSRQNGNRADSSNTRQQVGGVGLKVKVAGSFQHSFTQRVCCSWQSARPGQHSRALEQAQSDICPEKNHCDMQVPSWRHISCHTDKNRYYT